MTERTIFLEALEIDDPTERLAYVDRACAGDATLQRQVGSLLAAHDRSGSFLDQPAVAPAGTGAYFLDPAQASAAEDPSANREPHVTDRTGSGTVIGPYQLVQEIGAGGMGTVYLAQQTTPVQRRVALKVIKRGMDSRQVIARFEAERQALALMDHPNIAKVHDGGTTDTGLPFFVMELVQGVPIIQYCDEHHFTLRQRLELFVPVCQAVQHAHQKGIIHRDLKPSNVLVAAYDSQPVPKVIDFGVAKAAGQPLTERTLVTGLGTVVGTLEYMSPEQAEPKQLDIDTRSDIYALGVLLYELLTGTTPLERKRVKAAGLLESLRIIREEETPKPSTRLSTAEGLPRIAANRGLEPKKLSGLVRGELDWIVMKCLEKDRTRRYETATGLAQDLQRYLHDEPVQACPPSAAYRFRKFARRHKGKLALAGLLLCFLILLGGGSGWVARNQAVRELVREQEVARALAEAQEFCRLDRLPEGLVAIKRAEALLAGGEGTEELRGRVNQVHADVAMAARLEAIRIEQTAVTDGHFDLAGAEPRYQRAFKDYGLDVAALDPEQLAERIQASAIKPQLLAALDDWLFVKTYTALPGGERLLAALGRADTDVWRTRLREAFQRRDKEALEDLARDPKLLPQPPATVVLLAQVLNGVRKRPLAIAVLRSAQSQHPNDFWINHTLASNLMKSQSGPAAEAVGYYRAALALRPNSSGAHLNLGSALKKAGDLAGAEAEARLAIALKRDYAEAHANLGLALEEQGKLEEAIAAYRKALALKPGLARANATLGDALRQQGKLEEAIAACRKAIKLEPDSAVAHNNLGLALRDKGDLTGASAAFRKAITLKPDLAETHTNLGLALQEQGKLEEAIAACRQAIALKPDLAEAHHNLGIALKEQGKLEEAIAAYRKAIALKPDDAEAHYNLGIALRAKGDLAGASAAYQKAIGLKPDHARAHYNLGNALRDKGDLAGASAAFHKAIALKPDNADAHCNLGIILRANGDLPGAGAAFRQAIAVREQQVQKSLTAPGPHSGLGGALNNLAQVLRDQGQLAEARQLLERAIGHQRTALKVQPQNPTYRQFLRNHYLNLAETLVRLGEHGAAARTAAELPRTVPDGWAEYHRAAAFLARCVPLAEKDGQLSAAKRADQAQSYGDQAMAMLRQAVRKGFKDAGKLKKDPAFAPLQSRADFQQLLTELEAGTKGAKEGQSAKP